MSDGTGHSVITLIRSIEQQQLKQNESKINEMHPNPSVATLKSKFQGEREHLPSLMSILKFITHFCWNKTRELVGIDTRSLALFRILVAMTTLFDTFDRLRDLNAHYSDYGVFPRSLMYEGFYSEVWASIFVLSGSPVVVFVMFALHAICACFLLVGYRTRIATVLCWIFTISIQNRCYFISFSGDWEYRDLLLFSIALPLGQHFSIDALLESPPKISNQEKEKKERARAWCSNPYLVANFITVGFTVQILVMYFTAHFHKIGRAWVETHTATWLALQLDFFRRPLGDLFVMFPGVCAFLTWGVLKWQLGGCSFYVNPIYSGPSRTFAVVGYLAMHLGFASCLRLGTFSWINVAGILALLPSYFWDSMLFPFLERKVTHRSNFRFIFNPDCEFCTMLAKVCQIFLLVPSTKFHPVKKISQLSESNENEKQELLKNINNQNPLTCMCGCDSDVARRFETVFNERNGCFGVYFENDPHFKTLTFVAALKQAMEISPLFWPIGRLLFRLSLFTLSLQTLIRYFHPLVMDSTTLLGVRSQRFTSHLEKVLADDDSQTISSTTTTTAQNLTNNNNQNNNDIGNSTSTVPLISATQWIPSFSPSGFVTLWNGDGVTFETTHQKRQKQRQAPMHRMSPYWAFCDAFTWFCRNYIMIFMNLIAICCATIIITYNFENIGWKEWGVPTYLNKWVHAPFGLEQYWGVFAPQPPDAWWYLNIEGELKNQTQLELWDNGGIFRWKPKEHSFERPKQENFLPNFKNHRWFKYYENGMLTHDKRDLLSKQYLSWVCKEFNRRYDNSLQHVNLWVMWERLNWEDIFSPRFPAGQSLHFQIDCPKEKESERNKQKVKEETKTIVATNFETQEQVHKQILTTS